MAIGVEWDVPLNEADLQHLVDAYTNNSSMREFLPSMTPVRALVLQLSMPGGGFVPEDRIGGFDLKQFRPDGSIPWALSARPELVSCNCTDYDRWATVKPRALELLNVFVDAALRLGKNIKAVGLQYQDSFTVEGSIDKGALNSLFRKDSNWLPNHLLEKHSLWHCHQGWYSISPKERRVLNNFNLDFLEQAPNHLIKINGQHRIFSLRAAGGESSPIGLDELEQALDFLHSQNKEALRGVLCEEMLDRIGFDKGEKK
ncbi:MAG: TIGR04255 family protein [Cytophagaceae bacterium]|nr:MAG: TIGR04255 family protein [Cytophagaceae bacterium]